MGTVCAYDRPGFGWSERAQTSRTPTAHANELNFMLNRPASAQRLPPPGSEAGRLCAAPPRAGRPRPLCAHGPVLCAQRKDCGPDAAAHGLRRPDSHARRGQGRGGARGALRRLALRPDARVQVSSPPRPHHPRALRLARRRRRPETSMHHSHAILFPEKRQPCTLHPAPGSGSRLARWSCGTRSPPRTPRSASRCRAVRWAYCPPDCLTRAPSISRNAPST